MRASGAKTSVKFAQEKVWKEAIDPGDLGIIHGMNIRSINLGGNKNQFQSETINQFRAVVGLGDGNKAVEGNIVTDFLPEGMEVLLRHLLGKGTVTTTGSGPWTHAFKGVADTMQGLMIQKAFTSIDEYFVYRGCRINSMAINVIQEGFHDVTWDIIGTSEQIYATDQLNATSAIYPTKSGFTGYQAKVQTDLSGSWVDLGNVISGNLNITNNVETDGYVLGSDERAAAEHGTRECTGGWSMFFEDTTLYALYQSGVECGIRWVFDNGVDSITFEFPKVKMGGDSPAIESAAGVNLNLTFQARLDTASETDVKVTIVNSLSEIEEEPA
jgi:hypothetical protein